MHKLRAITGGKSTEASFERFIVPLFDSLYRRAYRLMRNTDDAEDLVQEVCIRAYRAFDDLKSMDNPAAWLHRVLYRLFVDLTRRNASSPAIPLSALEKDLTSVEAVSPDPGPADQTEADLLERRLHDALRFLKPEEQALLVLHEVEGYSLAEIEQIAELPPGTVKSRLHRARVKLGRLLQRTEHESTPTIRDSNHELSRHHRSAG